MRNMTCVLFLSLVVLILNIEHMFAERRLRKGECTGAADETNTVQMRYTALDNRTYEFAISLHESNSDQVISKGIKEGLFGRKGTYPSVDELHSVCEYVPVLKCGKRVVLVEVGSAVGMVSLYAASRGMKVYAFDPLLPNVEKLRTSKCINNMGNLAVIWGLVGSKSDPLGSWVESEPGNLAATMRGGGSVKARVPVVTVDEAVVDYAIEVLLLTCQGCELDALKGASRHLENHAIKSVIWRHHDQAMENSFKIAQLLQKYGYRFYSLDDARAGKGTLPVIEDIFNYLTLPRPSGSHPNVLSVR